MWNHINDKKINLVENCFCILSSSGCKYMGQLIADGDSRCSFMMCGYGPEPYTDPRTDRLALVAKRQMCPIGTAIPRKYPVGYGAPCAELSMDCAPSKFV